MTVTDWPTRTLNPTDLRVGPCAWGVAMCVPEHEDVLVRCPSLVVANADDDEDFLQAAGTTLKRVAERCGDGMPLMLGVHEPEFARRFEVHVRKRMDALGVGSVDVLTLWVDEVQDLKSGGVLQAMFELRSAGVARYVGLAHRDVLGVEWMAKNSAVHVLVTPYHLDDQAARFRALEAAGEHGMAGLALLPPAPTADAVRFALAESSRALPILNGPVPRGLEPMAGEEIDGSWRAYQAAHDAPPPLPRGRPPGD